MLTIKQWQQPGRDTRVYNKFDTFKCHECKERTTSVSSMSLICCAVGRTLVQYCSDCWDTVEWTCPDCNKNPENCDVVGCERCGQWTHLGCQTTLGDKKDYVCASCKESARAHTLVPKMKAECYDLAKQLATAKFCFFHSRKALESNSKCYEKKIDEQAAELERADAKVASLATDVMQQADGLQAVEKGWKASKDELADVHGHYANEISTLKSAIGNKQRSEEQEIIALRDNNKRLLNNNGSLAKSNTKLKLALQDERAMRVDMMSGVKKTNKRARYIYEQQGERIADLKKARVTIRWNGSMPQKLQERLLLQRYRDAWVEFKCQWQDYFGEIRVRAHYAKGPIVYNTLDGFMHAIRKRDNK